jgi:hypothetical protein
MTYTLKDLRPNTAYFTRVAANNAYGQGEFSKSVSKKGKEAESSGVARTITSVPGPVHDLLAFCDELGDVKISWSKPLFDGGLVVSRYRMVYWTSANVENPYFFTHKGAPTCYLRNPRPQTTYYIDVLPINNDGLGPLTGEPVTASTPPLVRSKWIQPRAPARPTLDVRVVAQKEIVYDKEKFGSRVTSRDCECYASWFCPEDFDKKTGFIFDPDHQTHPIQEYTLRVIAFKVQEEDHDNLKESNADELNVYEVKQVRSDAGLPMAKLSKKLGDLLPGRWYYPKCVLTVRQATPRGRICPLAAALRRGLPPRCLLSSLLTARPSLSP